MKRVVGWAVVALCAALGVVALLRRAWWLALLFLAASALAAAVLLRKPKGAPPEAPEEPPEAPGELPVIFRLRVTYCPYGYCGTGVGWMEPRTDVVDIRTGSETILDLGPLSPITVMAKGIVRDAAGRAVGCRLYGFGQNGLPQDCVLRLGEPLSVLMIEDIREIGNDDDSLWEPRECAMELLPAEPEGDAD